MMDEIVVDLTLGYLIFAVRWLYSNHLVCSRRESTCRVVCLFSIRTRDAATNISPTNDKEVKFGRKKKWDREKKEDESAGGVLSVCRIPIDPRHHHQWTTLENHPGRHPWYGRPSKHMVGSTISLSHTHSLSLWTIFCPFPFGRTICLAPWLVALNMHRSVSSKYS